APARDRREPRAAPRPEPTVHAVEVDERAAAPASRRDAFGQHVDDRIKVVARKPPEAVRAPHEGPELLDTHLSGRDRGGALLGEDVERVLGDAEDRKSTRLNSS